MSVRRPSTRVAFIGAALLSACIRAPSSPADGLVAGAITVVATQDTTSSLRTTVTVTNRSDSPVSLEYGGCATQVTAYRSAAADAAPVWNSELRRSWPYGQPVICLTYAIATKLAPGASLSPREFTLALPLIEVLGDSLPDGHYYFRAGVGFVNRPSITQVPAGEAELALARPPLAVTRRSFLMLWSANPVTVRDGIVTARATGTVVNANSALIQLERNCPLLIRVYRDRTRRDEAPRSGAPDWSQPACVPVTETTALSRGDTRTFETTVAVKDILGASLPSGTYYFAMLVKGDGMEMGLSAGELDLTRVER